MDISEHLIIVGVRVLITFSSSYTVFVPLPAFALMVLPYTGCTETMRIIVLMAAEEQIAFPSVIVDECYVAVIM